MRATSAFFAGVGTVAVAIGAGLGGGLLLGDIMSPQQPKYPSSEVTRLEQRGSPQIQAANGASQPVPYLSSTQAAATAADPPAQQPQQPQSQLQAQPQQPAQPPQQAQPQPQQASAKPVEPKQQPEPSANTNTKSQSTAVATQPPATTEQSAVRERAGSEDAYAKARDADLKRDSRRAEDRRKSERRQRWAERGKWRRDDAAGLNDAEAKVREATEPRSFFGREEPRRSFGRDEPRQTFGRDEPRPTFRREEPRPMFGGDQGFGRIRIFDDD